MIDFPEAGKTPRIEGFTTFELKPRGRALRPGIAVLMVLVLMLFGLALGIPLTDWLPQRIALSGGALLGLVVGALLWPRLTRGFTPAPIEVSLQRIRLPKRPGSRATVQIPLAEITSVEARSDQRGPLLLLGTSRGAFQVPVHHFVDPHAPGALCQAVYVAIARQPNGVTQLGQMQDRAHRGIELIQKRTGATTVLFWTIGAVFLIELALGAPDSPVATLRCGANSPVLVRAGQWWRLFTAGFLHLSYVHIFFNASTLLSFGAVVEKLVGTARFLVVIFVSSLAGNLMSLTGRPLLYSAGASSMLFGLIGALLVINLRHRATLPAGFFLGARRWAWLLGVNFMISLIPGVDGRAHLGGLVAGSLLTWWLVPVLDVNPPEPHPVARIAAIGLTAAFLVAFGTAVYHGLKLQPAQAEAEFEQAAAQLDEATSD